MNYEIKILYLYHTFNFYSVLYWFLSKGGTMVGKRG